MSLVQLADVSESGDLGVIDVDWKRNQFFVVRLRRVLFWRETILIVHRQLPTPSWEHEHSHNSTD